MACQTYNREKIKKESKKSNITTTRFFWLCVRVPYFLVFALPESLWQTLLRQEVRDVGTHSHAACARVLLRLEYQCLDFDLCGDKANNQSLRNVAFKKTCVLFFTFSRLLHDDVYEQAKCGQRKQTMLKRSSMNRFSRANCQSDMACADFLIWRFQSKKSCGRR